MIASSRAGEGVAHVLAPLVAALQPAEGVGAFDGPALTSSWCLGDAAVHDDLRQDQADDAVMGLQRDLLEPAEDPVFIHSSRHYRIVVAEQVRSAMASYEQPNLGIWTSFSTMMRSAICSRAGERDHGPGWPGSAAKWSRSSSSSHDEGSTRCLMQNFASCKNPLRLLPVRPAPTARAGPEGLHSQPVLHNAHGLPRAQSAGTPIVTEPVRVPVQDTPEAWQITPIRAPSSSLSFPG